MTASAPRRTVAFAPLLAALGEVRVCGALPPDATGIALDSRAVAPGDVFVALRGTRTDGHAFLAAAVRRGAGALVVDDPHAAGAAAAEIPVLVVPDTRRALSRLAAAFYGEPSRTLTVAGITGTNGKTTVAHLALAMLVEAGTPAGIAGTLGARFGERTWPLGNTTPLALELQQLLAEMRDGGARAVVMEVSSHALALERVADVRFRLGVLTNVTRDHLDFHETLAAYAAAKRRLFAVATEAVLNADDPYGRQWAAELAAGGAAPLTYGLSADAAVRADDLWLGPAGATFSVAGQRYATRLPGRFNVSNALAALCLARALGVDDRTAARALANFPGVPGRMEHFAAGGVDVLVDYAHTPDALAAVLRAARETARGRLVAVFGCGGERDRGKRPEMGRIAQDLADLVVVTSDNPRREDPAAIVRDIAAGLRDGVAVAIEPDRRVAIRRAIAEAAAGDVVVVAGKGHETYQIVGDRSAHFDDRDEVRAALAARMPAAE